MTIRFVLKNGKQIDMKCEKFDYTTSKFDGTITSYKASGVTKNDILCINFNEIVAVYRLVSDEKKGEIYENERR